MFWFIMVAAVFALHMVVVFWPEKKRAPANIDWLDAFAKHVVKSRRDVSYADAYSAACASYVVMADEDPIDAANVEMMYWD